MATCIFLTCELRNKFSRLFSVCLDPVGTETADDGLKRTEKDSFVHVKRPTKRALTRVAVEFRIVVLHEGNIKYTYKMQATEFEDTQKMFGHLMTDRYKGEIDTYFPLGSPNVLFCRLFPKFIICENSPKVT